MNTDMATTTEPLDVRGKTITTYILARVVDALDDLEVGDSIELITDDFEPIEPDVAAWCRTTGHELRDVTHDDGMARFTLPSERRKMSTGGLRL